MIDSQDEQSTIQQDQLKEPALYRVIMLNDDYTSQEFVVEILVSIFHKEQNEASNIMLEIHKKGQSTVGIYTYDIAMSRINAATQEARRKEYPLRCKTEKL